MTATPSASIVVAYFSGYGHTSQIADAVAEGARSVTETEIASVNVETMGDGEWDLLDRAEAIIFGSPTYMGTAAGAFHVFAQSTSKRWMDQAWRDKLAAGFTNSGSMSGDKMHTLQYLSLLAAQHGMLWVSLGLMPGWNTTTASIDHDNRLGFYLGAGAQSFNDSAEVHDADLSTARHLGARVAQLARVHQAGRAAVAA